MITKEISIVTAPPETRIEYIRLPRAKKRDPVFGLSRTTINSLVLPTALNDFQPPVRSFVLRKPGARTGVRLILVSSLREYIQAQEQEPGRPCRAAQDGHDAHSDIVEEALSSTALQAVKSKPAHKETRINKKNPKPG